MSGSSVEIFGIRHHGPGSARRLVQALDVLQPAAVLIEGPVDASPLLSFVGHEDLKPPVALLCYAADEPERAGFWPFASFSPEYQAALWANGRGVPVRFIDLPATARFPDDFENRDEETDAAAEQAPGTEGTESEDPGTGSPGDQDPVHRDPLGALASAAGYEDGESWWSDVIEEGGGDQSPHLAFEAVADAMTVLRETETDLELREARREAHMRLRVAEAIKEFDGPVAVVCGAWHVPALKAKHAAKHDRALLKGMKKPKTAATWAPWTAPRLSLRSGYGAGIRAPGWCQHLWDSDDQVASRWLARIARQLRANGQIVSTASLIEAERLATALCVLRDKPAPGFEELRDAAIACLCFGEPLLWRTIETELLIGAEVGEIPDDVPLSPLLEDLKRCQKTARLKPEALERDLSVDLRSDSGLYRSTLLHRLAVLDVPWGQLQDAGRSRGTFRERWQLAWQPEFAVRLVEHLVHGPTIEKAANALLASRMHEETGLGDLARLVEQALTADLGPALEAGLKALEHRAAQADHCQDILQALPSLARTVRYGEARTVQIDRLPVLVERLAVQAAIALPYAGRNLDAQMAGDLGAALAAADEALRLLETAGPTRASWARGLHDCLDDRQTAPLVAGKVANLLHAADGLTDGDTAILLETRLSPGTPTLDAAGFFEGFFQGAAQHMIHDEGLRRAVSAWLTGLDLDDFTENLPLLRRVFADLDAMERKRLIDAVMERRSKAPAGLQPLDEDSAVWMDHFNILSKLLAPREAQ